MDKISPSELSDNYCELSRLCKDTGKPVYITVDGKVDTALISATALNELYARIDLFEKLSLGLKDITNGNTKTHEEVFAKFGKR